MRKLRDHRRHLRRCWISGRTLCFVCGHRGVSVIGPLVPREVLEFMLHERPLECENCGGMYAHLDHIGPDLDATQGVTA